MIFSRLKDNDGKTEIKQERKETGAGQRDETGGDFQIEPHRVKKRRNAQYQNTSYSQREHNACADDDGR